MKREADSALASLMNSTPSDKVVQAFGKVVTAWFLIALATTVTVSGSFGVVAETIGEAVAFTLVMALAYTVVNLLVDVSYSLLNPRIRIGGAAGGG